MKKDMKGYIMQPKKVITDMIINIVASVIPVAVLQLLVLPRIAIVVGDESYGLIVTLVALLSVVPSTFGNVLNNIRLLHNESYIEKDECGDFNILLLISEVLCTFIVFTFSWLYLGGINIKNIILLIAASVLWLARDYYVVVFRIRLNYYFIFLDNCILSVGHIIGWRLFVATGDWQLVYIIGYAASLTFIITQSALWKEPLERTGLFYIVTKESIILMVANVLNRLMTYADKLLLYPLLGGAMVSIYYAASIFAKIAALAITPITSVILSYISKMKKRPDSVFKITMAVGIFVCAIVYVACLVVAKPVLTLIYPQFVDEAIVYIPITSAAMVFITLSTIINPFILKFYDINWQIKINAVSLVFYVVSSYCLLKALGLLGFCIGVALTNLIKTLYLIYVYTKRSNDVSTSA